MKPGAGWIPVAAALAVRVVAIALSDRVVADVLRYRRVAAHVLDVSWNPYQAARLYPYPPVWVWVEAACEWLARHSGLSFAVLVKLPVLAAELAIVALLARWGAERGGAARWAAWIYAVHPVAVLVSGFHGQFDSLPLLMLLMAVRGMESGRHDAAALALAAAIALKPFPVLALPVLLLRVPGTAARLRFLALSLLPVAVLLVPFLAHDAAAVVRELFGYGGVADFGWIGVWRGARWMAEGTLGRGEARHWGALIPAAKILFLAAYAVVLARRRGDPAVTILAVLVAFNVFYGALSAQYLLWVVPLAVLRPDRWLVLHGAAATLGLVGFYLFLAPGVLTPAGAGAEGAGTLWVVGATASLLASAGWLLALRNDSQPRQGTDVAPLRSTTVWPSQNATP